LANHTVYLSLGSNLGERIENLQDAERRLARLGNILGRFSLYETEPVDVAEEQPWYMNCVIVMETGLSPDGLLAGVLEIEQAMGRRRGHAKISRTIDIDIILFGNLQVAAPELTIPHPEMQHRRFVLEPLVEVAPEALNPKSGKAAKELLAELPAKGGIVRRVVIS